mgnify:CR=1 FL=1
MKKHPVLLEIEALQVKASKALTRVNRREEIDLRGLDDQADALYRLIEEADLEPSDRQEATRALGQLIRTMDDLERDMGAVITQAKGE